MEPYVFRSYTPAYVREFEDIKEELVGILGDQAVIEHVGSTAVPDLGGKGIIDIAVGVRENIDNVRRELEKSGYVYRPRASTQERAFLKRSDGRVHLHVTFYGGQDWTEMLAFRDYLRDHPEVRQAYRELKQQAAEAAQGDGEYYRSCKEGFIGAVLREAFGGNDAENSGDS